mmetsp:Transcript_12525/g.27006  ORF Transcript_12525/g.27006 Transcript_12525/m.27006 type:complete len:729 (+) Transcript_12525:243-2429(+)|eukprot:CAMPEP_0202907064 /NCGR_PEP_ID=MMETSP1392-20130828/41185_1 /ASSEMBLY_ACC=CAM_ASM_000868 /TAXON_ID=225041 /ORGANISM="Chlamydomonas chlamydogama, Strain SAG 11-48b" /LENGTH=728 /DNA_ID=CAMNT_0049595807 /DNA_START=195 /DNA_END=2381 /DNA_ORIENTATION=-
MARQPRFLKLQEFVAHAGNVNCIEIGRKSSGVLVTGGDDKRVNLWTIGTQTRTLTLSGHQSSVMSVTFDQNEEVVAAGAQSGSIKVFDLDQAKVTKSFTGHKSDVLCLELNDTFGLVSGSMDTNIKVWDLRQKDCRTTLKGHKGGVTHVRFSPDGKWVASGGMDGEVKIWEAGSGRVLTELNGHTNSITGLEFNPIECVLATSSSDKTVRLWDMEYLKALEQTAPEATAVRAITWHPDGRHVFAAIQDGLRVWSYDPVTQHDNIDMPWSKVSDISVLLDKNKLVGCSYNQSFVGLWVVDLKDVRPFASDPVPGNSRDFGVAPSRSANRDPPLSRERSSSSASNGNVGAVARNLRDMNLNRPASYDQPITGVQGIGARAGAPRSRAEASSYPAPGPSSAYQEQPLPPPPVPQLNRFNSNGGNRQYPVSGVSRVAFESPSGSDLYRDRQPQPSASSASSSASKPGMVSVAVGVGDSLLRNQVEPGQLHAPAAQGAQLMNAGRGGAGAGYAPRPSRYTDNDDASGSAAPASSAGQARRSAGVARSGGPLDAAPSPRPRNDLDVLTEVVAQHENFKAALSFRHNNLQMAHKFIQRHDMRGAMSHVRRCGDATVGADLLAGMISRRDYTCTLELVPDIVPVLEKVLSLPSDRHVQVALEMGNIIYKSFGQLIKDTCANQSRAVDISYEQRLEKCNLARTALQGLATKLAHVAKTGGDTVAVRAQDLAGLFAGL